MHHACFSLFILVLQEIERPYTIIEEDSQSRKAIPSVRVEKMFEQIMAKLAGPPEFLLCVLPERKNCDIYGSNCAVSISRINSFLTKVISYLVYKFCLNA